MKRRVQRGRAHCLVSENTTRRFASLAAQHPKVAGRLRVRTLDIRPGEADTDIVLTLGPESPPSPFRGYGPRCSPAGISFGGGTRRSATTIRNLPDPLPSRRPASQELHPNKNPKAFVQSVLPDTRPCKTRNPSTSPERSRTRQQDHPAASGKLVSTGRAKLEPFAPPKSKQHPLKDGCFDHRTNCPRKSCRPWSHPGSLLRGEPRIREFPGPFQRFRVQKKGRLFDRILQASLCVYSKKLVYETWIISQRLPSLCTILSTIAAPQHEIKSRFRNILWLW